MPKRLPLTLFAAAALAVAAPAAASAATLCVNRSGCAPAGTYTDLQAALTAAQMAAGFDTVLVGPGTYSAPNGFAYGGSPLNQAFISGAGAQTVITLPSSSMAGAAALNLQYGAIEDARVLVSDQTGIGDTAGIRLSHAYAQRVVVSDDGTPQGTQYGVYVGDGGALLDGTVSMTAAATEQTSVAVNGMGTRVEGSALSGRAPLRLQQGDGVVRRVRASAPDGTAVIAVNGGWQLLDSAFSGKVALELASTPDVLAEGLTLRGGAGGAGLDATSTANATFTGYNVAIAGPVAVWRGAADVLVDDAAFDRATLSAVDSGTWVDQGGPNLEPVFADAVGHLPAGSPLIDAGQLRQHQGPTDVDGGTRVVGAAVDIGASEWVPVPPSAGGSGDASPPPVGANVEPDATPVLPPAAPAAGPRDTAAPVVTRLRRSGRTLKLRLSEDATVTVRLTAPGRKPRTISRALDAGDRTLRLPRLSAGRTRLVVRATDAAGNRSAARSLITRAR